MSMSDDEEFQNVDTGASNTIPTPCGALRKGGYVMLKGYPCKIVDLSTAKTGKHGAAKASITGIDIFTNRKHEKSISTGHNANVPVVTRTEYQLVDIAEDSFITLMCDDGTTKADLRLPTDEDSAEMVSKLRKDFSLGKELIIGVIAACSQERVVSYREDNQ